MYICVCVCVCVRVCMGGTWHLRMAKKPSGTQTLSHPNTLTHIIFREPGICGWRLEFRVWFRDQFSVLA